MYPLKITFSKDFNEKYHKFYDMLSDILEVKDPPIFGNANTEKQFEVIEDIVKKGDKKEKLKAEIKNEIKTEEHQNDPTKTKPHTFVKNGVGYFKFYKEGENIKIGKEKTRHFRFLQSLCIPNFGTEKTTDEVFEAVKNDKDLKDSVLTGFDTPQKKTRMLTILKNSCIKELQKNKGLKRISYKFDNTEKRVWLKLEE